MKKIRTANGMSITELLVSTILMGFCFSVIGELVVLNTLAATKLTNKTDGLSASRFAAERIKNDVKVGKAFLATYNSPVGSFADDSQTLIVQQPVFYKDSGNPNDSQNGFPVKADDGTELVNVVIYKVVQDSTNPNEFLLQVSRFVSPVTEWPKSNQNFDVRAPITTPVTILSGIVGPKDPLDPTKPPQVFQYIESIWDSVNEQYSTSLVKSDAHPMIGGVTIDLEVKRGSDANKKYATTFGSHSEAFLKYNRNAELTNL